MNIIREIPLAESTAKRGLTTAGFHWKVAVESAAFQVAKQKEKIATSQRTRESRLTDVEKMFYGMTNWNFGCFIHTDGFSCPDNPASG